MKRTLSILLILFFAACTLGPDIKDGMTFDTSVNRAGTGMTIAFERGPDYVNLKKMGFMTVRITPQIAIWMEDTLGRYLGTVYVTAGFGDQKWKFYAPKGDTCFRTMCMPYWLNKYRAAGNSAPTRSKPLPDAVTGATPTGGFSVNFSVPDSVRVFKLFVEWNRSFDNNATFTKEKSSFNGQPSVIVGCRINLDDTTRASNQLTLVGRGGETGDDGNLYDDAAKLTTALTVFGRITASRR
jgi:hypothetical protein